jgi:ankyrin repeat protein
MEQDYFYKKIYEEKDWEFVKKDYQNFTIEQKRSVFKEAAGNSQFEIVNLLIKQIDINHESYSPFSPLSEAAENGDIEMMELLIKAGAKIDGINSSNFPLMHAVRRRKLEAIRFLLVKGANPSKRCSYDTLLHEIVEYNWERWGFSEDSIVIVKMLLEFGANINDTYKDINETPLFDILLKGKVDYNLAQFFIDSGADVNWQNKFGNTPLYYAIRNQQIDVINFLIKNNANLDIKNNEGKNVYNFARKTKNKEILSILNQANPKSNLLKSFSNLNFVQLYSSIFGIIGLLISFILLFHNLKIATDFHKILYCLIIARIGLFFFSTSLLIGISKLCKNKLLMEKENSFFLFLVPDRYIKNINFFHILEYLLNASILITSIWFLLNFGLTIKIILIVLSLALSYILTPLIFFNHSLKDRCPKCGSSKISSVNNINYNDNYLGGGQVVRNTNINKSRKCNICGFTGSN